MLYLETKWEQNNDAKKFKYLLSPLLYTQVFIYSFLFIDEVVWNEYKMTGAVSKHQLTFGDTRVV